MKDQITNPEQLRTDNYIIKFSDLPHFVRALMITDEVQIIVPENDKQFGPKTGKLANDEVRVLLQYRDPGQRNIFNKNYDFLKKDFSEDL